MILDRGSSKSVRDEVAQENERGRRQRMESADKLSMKEEDESELNIS